jgi:predicted nuclease of predicted toxin-antitoxin system
MKFKLDENIPTDLVKVLGGIGHDVDTVPQEALTGRPDSVVWACTQEAERLLITQDMDFADTRRFAPGTHNGIILVRLGSPSRRQLLDRIGSLFLNEPVEEWHGSFIVVTDRKLRVVRPH